jgi:hypothetical protein
MDDSDFDTKICDKLLYLGAVSPRYAFELCGMYFYAFRCYYNYNHTLSVDIIMDTHEKEKRFCPDRWHD